MSAMLAPDQSFEFTPGHKRTPGYWSPTMRRADRVQSHFCGTSDHVILKNLEWKFCSMAKLIFGMMQSLDGYVDHLELGPPDPVVVRHFIEQVRGVTGMVYGRR